MWLMKLSKERMRKGDEHLVLIIGISTSHITPHCIMTLPHIMSYYTTLHRTKLHHTTLHDTTQHSTALDYLHHTALHHTHCTGRTFRTAPTWPLRRLLTSGRCGTSLRRGGGLPKTEQPPASCAQTLWLASGLTHSPLRKRKRKSKR